MSASSDSYIEWTEVDGVSGKFTFPPLYSLALTLLFAGPMEKFRGTQGKAATEELLDMDGKSWLPPPCIWEDRGDFDFSKFFSTVPFPPLCMHKTRTNFFAAFVTLYIRYDWLPYVQETNATFDLKDERFRNGLAPIDGSELVDPFYHEECVPGQYTINSLDDFSDTALDLEYSDNKQKQLNSTAHTELVKWNADADNCFHDYEQLAINKAARFQEIANAVHEKDPFAPTIDVYMR